MMKMNRLLWAAVLSFATVALAADWKREQLSADVQDTIALFKKTDSSLKDFFEKSAGYAVFPKITKGAIGVGAAHGEGQVFEKGKLEKEKLEKEKLAGKTKLTQVTVGFQLGGQVYAEVIFFEDEKTLKDFKEGNVEFSAQVSAVAAAEGASKNAKYKLGVAVFTVARGGLMYEASIGGQKFSYEPYEDAETDGSKK